MNIKYKHIKWSINNLKYFNLINEKIEFTHHKLLWLISLMFISSRGLIKISNIWKTVRINITIFTYPQVFPKTSQEFLFILNNLMLFFHTCKFNNWIIFFNLKYKTIVLIFNISLYLSIIIYPGNICKSSNYSC